MPVNPFLKFKRLSELVSLDTSVKPKIVLEPGGDYVFNTNSGKDELGMSVVIDKTQWEIPEELQEFVSNLTINSELNNEEKILKLFEELSKSYTYDDNILSYIRKVDDDKFALPDWYGREVDSTWKKNRSAHTKRVCYEVSRYLAKSLEKVFENQPNYGVCILWNESLTHYFVGLTSNEYDITLDLDNFENIKDLTRVKTNLTIEGIKILKDPFKKFTSALDYYNSSRDKYSVKAISSELEDVRPLTQDSNLNDDDNIAFFSNALQILNEKYHLDPQGIFEYMKEIVDVRLGPKSREKIWKKSRDKHSGYTRCLLLDFSGYQDKDKNQLYLIDVDEKQIRPFDKKEFEIDDPTFTHFKGLIRDWDDIYDGK